MNKKQKELLLELICEKQIQMMLEDRYIYESNDYADLEELKTCVKNICNMDISRIAYDGMEVRLYRSKN